MNITDADREKLLELVAIEDALSEYFSIKSSEMLPTKRGSFEEGEFARLAGYALNAIERASALRALAGETE